MHVFELTRQLIDIESITSNEREMGDVLLGYLAEMARRHGGQIERMPVEAGRYNVCVGVGDPLLAHSTQMDTVTPHITSHEDEDRTRRRSTCDTKGTIAAMIPESDEL